MNQNRMRGNWINFQDFAHLGEIIRIGKANFVFKRLFLSSQKKIQTSWGLEKKELLLPGSIPMVAKRWNNIVSGENEIDYIEYICQKYLKSKDNLLMLSLACGTGTIELRWAATKKFKRIDAFDISETRIRYAQNNALQKGLDPFLQFQIGDIAKLNFSDRVYDIILAEGALHHFRDLEIVLPRLANWLKNDGLLVVNDFVGPSRFQWQPIQVMASNTLLNFLPAQYRIKWHGKSIKKKVRRPGRLAMILTDPSEAVESGSIMPLLEKIFTIEEVYPKGGSLVNLIFHEIAHNFLNDSDPITKSFLELCFKAEDFLLASGMISSDYVLAIYRNH